VRSIRVLPLVLALFPLATSSEPERPPSVETLVDGLVRTSQDDWDLAPIRAAAARDPEKVIRVLVARLDDGTLVSGSPLESQLDTVCGNALTLLERLTEERICGCGKDWIGFTTHDHRGQAPDPEKVSGPWIAWLEVRRDVPVDEWFWGLSFRELERFRPLLRTAPESWAEADVERVLELKRRAYPFLLDKLLDDEFAGKGRRICDQANALLRRLKGFDFGEIERHELLRLPPEHPDREHRIAVAKNRASMALTQRRWMAAVLARPTAKRR
jgi:hypothetical protein